MKLETVLVNGMRIQAIVSEGQNGSYIATIGRQSYACQKKGKFYTLRGESLRASFMGDKPLFPEEKEPEPERPNENFEPGLYPI